MKEAPKPRDEAGRIAALCEYRVLDTLPEQAYDDITYLAAQICGTPIALVSLVDDDRQWFKSRVGLDAPETPRNLAFCAHAILQPEDLFVVEDATLDERFADNPLVTGDPNVRFYVGAPLVTSEGHALGTLCVIDRVPRELSPHQSESLRALSRQVIAQLELRLAVGRLRESADALRHRSAQVERSRDELAEMCRVLEGQAEVIERDLHRAETIQRCLLPHETPQVQNFCLQAFYRPGHNIGGDLYDVVGVADRYVAFVLADAAGHGVSAAMLSVLFKHRLRIVDETGAPYGPAEALRALNEALRKDVCTAGIFVTAAYCLLDTQERTAVIASAGHPPVMWIRETGSYELIEHTGPALGLYGDATFDEREIDLAQGDKLLMYTDGLFEVSKSDSCIDTLAKSLHRHTNDPNILEKLLVDVSEGHEHRDRDDVTMLLIEAKPGESHLYEATTESIALEPTAEPTAPTLYRADDGETTILCLGGRVTWIHGQALLDATREVIDARRALVVDLESCEYLDSTMLGTLHELVEMATVAGRPVSLQHINAELRSSFEELSMRVVLDRVSDDPLRVPVARTAVAPGKSDIRGQQMRLLKAHEVLAELSDENKEQFGKIVKAMRSDLA